MVSLKDIARMCGVSVATVSKAMNGQKDISAETRAAVLAAADQLGYIGNSAARALKTNIAYNIGVLFVDGRAMGLAHEYFSNVLESLKIEAESSGYDITFINRNVGRHGESYLQHCLYRGVDGVVIVSANFADPQVQELIDSQLPVVTIDHVFNNRIAVMSDNAMGGYTLAKYVHSMGHRRIAFIHGELTSVTENRLRGFYRACEELGVTPDPAYIRQGVYHDAESCAAITRELLDLPEPPSCILFPDDYSYIGGMNAITERGLRIPEDVSAVGYDGIHLATIVSPKLTTFRQDTDVLGREAARSLVGLIERPKTTLIDRIIVPGELMIGGSVKKLD